MTRFGTRLVAEPTVLTLQDGRELAFDDVGDRSGRPLLYVHGGPDCRLGRHPDDSLATRQGVRLIAIDRPGSGRSTVNAGGTFGTFAADVEVLADHLGVGRFAILAWSAGAMFGLACAARLPDRINRLGIVAGLPPVHAFDDPAVRVASPEGHLLFAEMAREMDAAELAATVAPMMLPSPLTLDLARQFVVERADAVRLAELAAVPGAVDQLARAKVEAVRDGTDGLRRDLELQATTPDIDLGAVTCPVDLWYGTADTNTPPAFGQWFVDQLLNADATLHVIEDAGHSLLLPRWAEVLAALTR